jgi:hypothetical protein
MTAQVTVHYYSLHSTYLFALFLKA